MKTFSKILFSLLLITSYSYVPAQNTNGKIKELKALVEETITKECYLTKRTQYDDIKIEKNKIVIGITFNNESLRSFWSPEVAVQYIFDAALQHMLDAINANIDKYKKFNKLIFNVRIRPHDIPSLISFGVPFKEWKAYKKEGEEENHYTKKERLYKNMTISAESKPFKFDAHEAVDIE